MNAPFEPERRQQDLAAKIIFALERAGESLRLTRAAAARQAGLTDLQLRILQHIAYHPNAKPGVSELSVTFQLKKPTVSETIRLLVQKGLIMKVKDVHDGRAYSLRVSALGQDTLNTLDERSDDHLKAIRQQSTDRQREHYRSLYELLGRFQEEGLVPLQRMCVQCRHYSSQAGQAYCRLLEIELTVEKLRIDCPEFEIPRPV